MTSQTKKVLTAVGVLALVLLLATSTALAHPITPDGDATGNNGSNGRHLSAMIEWMGAENWGQMIQRMNQIHGPEFTGRMIQQMNESGFCHDGNYDGPGSMMGRGFGGMMGRGFNNQMGLGFQNGGPDDDSSGQFEPGLSWRHDGPWLPPAEL